MAEPSGCGSVGSAEAGGCGSVGSAEPGAGPEAGGCGSGASPFVLHGKAGVDSPRAESERLCLGLFYLKPNRNHLSLSPLYGSLRALVSATSLRAVFFWQSRTMQDVVDQITVRDFEIADVRAQLRFELCRRQVTEGLLTKALQEIAFLERRLQSGEAGESSTKKARVEERPVEEKPTGSAAAAPPVGTTAVSAAAPVQPPPQKAYPLASGLSSGRVFLEPEAPELKMKAPPPNLVDDETAAEDAGGLPGPPTETMPRGAASKSAAPGDPVAAAAQEAAAAAAEEAAAGKAAEAAAAAKAAEESAAAKAAEESAAAKAAEAAAAKAAEAAAAKAAEAASAKAAEAAAAAAKAADPAPAAKAADPAPAAAAKAADPAGAKAAVGRPPVWTAYGDVSGYLKTGKLALQFCSAT